MDLLPIYDPQTGRQINQSAVQVPSFLRLANQPPVQPVEQPGVLGGGLAAGWEETMGLVNAASAAAGKLVGADGWAESEAADAQARFAEAQRVGRPDLEVAPWEEGGASILPWLAYQGAKQIPTTLGMAGAALLAAAAAPAAGAGGAIGAGLGLAGRGLAAAPTVLGGQGLRQGASFAARRAALEAGKATAARVAGAAALGAPLGAGSMYAEAIERGDPTWADAAKAIGLSPVYGALEAVLPSKLAKIAEEGATGGIVKRAITQGMEGLGQEMLTEGAQTALEMSFRPDLSLGEKASNVVNAALTGGAVGGMFGAGAGAMRKAKEVDPNALSTEALNALVDEGLMVPQLPGMNPTRVEAKEQVRRTETGSAFPKYTNEQVVAELDAATRKVMENPDAPMQDQARLNKLREEVTRRGIDLAALAPPAPNAPPAVQTVQGQPNLFGENLPIQLPPKVAAEQQAAGATQTPVLDEKAQQEKLKADATDLRRRAGVKGFTFATELAPMDEPDRINAVRERMEAGDATAGMAGLAKDMGILDDKARAALVEKTDTAIKRAEAAWTAVYATGKGEAQAKKLQQEAQRLQSKVEALAEADRRLTARTAPPAAEMPSASPAVAEATATTPMPDAAPVIVDGAPAPMQAAPAAPAAQPTPEQTLAAVQPLAEAATAVAPQTQMGEQLQAQLVAQQRRAEYDAAEGQRLEARAKAEALKVGVEPVAVRKVQPSPEDKTQATVQLSTGTVPLRFRSAEAGQRGGWYREDGRFVAASINDAAALLRAEAQDQQDADPIQPQAKALNPKTIRKQRRKQRETIRYMTKQGSLFVIHGGSDFEDIDGRFSGTGEPGNIRPLGRGLYGFVIDPSDPETAQRAISWAKRYSTKYGRGQKTLHVFEVPLSASTVFNGSNDVRVEGYPGPISGLNEPRIRPEEADLRMEHLPIGLTEVAINNAAVAKRVSKFGADENPDSILRALQRASEPHVTREELAQAVAETTRGWKGDLDVIVVETQAELPDSVKRMMRGEGVDRALGMVAQDGKVYLIAENIPTREMGVAVLFHETLGHKGLEAQFKGDLDRVMLDAYKGNSFIRAKTDEWMAKNPGAYKSDPNPKARAVEEVLSNMAMDGVIEAPIFAKLMAVVRNYIRKVGIKLAMSDAEVQAILAMAHAKVTKGSGRVVQRKANGQKYIFAGEQSLDTILDQQEEDDRRRMLEVAKQMDAQGNRTSEEIRIATGWFKGRYDKMWRYEILDIAAKLDINRLNAQQPTDPPLMLVDILKHDALYQAYPYLRSLSVTRKPGSFDFLQTQQGGYSESTKTLNITPYAIAPLSTMIHEIQHAIQSIEGFARGTNAQQALKQMRDDQLGELVRFVMPQLEGDMEKSRQRIAGFTAVKSWMRHPLVMEYYALQRRIDSMRGKDSLESTRSQLEREQSRVVVRIREAYAGSKDIETIFAPHVDAFINPMRQVMADNPEAAIDGLIRAENKVLDGYEEDRRDLMSNNPAVVRFKLQERKANYEAYIRSAGEIEARNVQARMGMDFKQSLDVAPLTGDREGRDFTPEQAGVDTEGGVSWESASLLDMEKVPGIIKSATEWKDEAVRKADLSGKTSRLREIMLGWLSMTELARRYDTMFKGGLAKLNRAYQFRATVSQKLSQLALEPWREFERLLGVDQKAADDTSFIMEATAEGIDPSLAWDAQSDDVKRHPDVERMKRAHAAYHKAYNRLAQKRQLGAYNKFKSHNQAQAYHHLTNMLLRSVQADPAVYQAIFGGRERPMLRMMRDEKLSRSPEAAAEFWKAELRDTISRVERFLEQQRGMPDAARNALSSPVAATLRQVQLSQTNIEKAPYFHLGRFGDYFVAFHVPVTDVNGRKEPDRAKLEAVAKRLEDAGFTGVRINMTSDRYNVFIRNESQETNFQLRQLAEQMQKEGLLDGSKEIKHGTRDQAFDIAAQDWMQQAIGQIRTSPQFQTSPDMSSDEIKRRNAMRDSLIEHMRSVMLDMLPDTSITKVMTHRESVPGFSRDMVRAQMHRAQVSAVTMSNYEAEPVITDAMGEIRTALEDLKTKNTPDIYEAEAVYKEVQMREQQRHRNEGRSWHDTLRAINHVYFLGLSPAYVLINMTQLYVMLWPNLSKKHGFVKAAKTIARVTPLALRIVMATAKEGFRTSWEAAPDATITSSALDNVKGLDGATRRFVLNMGNTGTLDIGSASREHGRVAEGRADDNLDLALRFGSSMGYYSEMAARLISALAARELEGGKKGEAATMDYAIEMVNGSMFTYSNWNIARLSSKSGVAGQMTPLMMSFMQYTLQLMETLYREGYTAIKGDTPQSRKEARRFMGAHLAAMLFFAGQLGGIPMMSMIAALIDNILGDDDEPFDFKTEMRNFYADLFGDDMAEVLTRGVPRALGIDISQRVGEADILPFTRLLADKRSWQDAASDYALNLLGSPVGMGVNLLAGGTEISNGNVFEGMKQMVPVAMKGPLEAMRLSNTGFVDKAGNVLPMTPNALQIMAQAGGFTPAPLADYREANLAQLQRRGQLTMRASTIRKNLMVAIERGDQEKMQDWLAQAVAFDQANPAQSILDDLEASLRKRARQRMIAEATNTPIGTNWRDAAALEFTRFLGD